MTSVLMVQDKYFTTIVNTFILEFILLSRTHFTKHMMGKYEGTFIFLLKLFDKHFVMYYFLI